MQTRINRKKTIINWSIRELEKLSQSPNVQTPEIVKLTIKNLRSFSSEESTTWADFATQAKSQEWNADLKKIDDIRAPLLNFMWQEGNEGNNIDKRFYAILEAMLLGFTEQWPRNNFEEIKLEKGGQLEGKEEKQQITYAPTCSTSSLRLTTDPSEAKENPEEEPQLAICTLTGYQKDTNAIRALFSREEEKYALIDLDTNQKYLPREHQYFNRLGLPDSKIIIRSQKAKFIGGITGFFASFAIYVPLVYYSAGSLISLLCASLVSYPLLLSILLLAGGALTSSLLGYIAIKLIAKSFDVGGQIGIWIDNKCGSYRITSIEAAENNKLNELQNLLNNKEYILDPQEETQKERKSHQQPAEPAQSGQPDPNPDQKDSPLEESKKPKNQFPKIVVADSTIKRSEWLTKIQLILKTPKAPASSQQPAEPAQLGQSNPKLDQKKRPLEKPKELEPKNQHPIKPTASAIRRRPWLNTQEATLKSKKNRSVITQEHQTRSL